MSCRRAVTALVGLGVLALSSASCVDDRAVGVDGSDPDIGTDGTNGQSGFGTGTTDGVTPELPAIFIDSLRSPLRLASAPGALLVSDSRLSMIVQIDPVTLRFEGAIRVQGKPLGVACYDRSIYVGNATRRTVEIYDALGGRRISDFGPDAVTHPSDIAVDAEEGLVFVVDGSAKEVKVFDPVGTPVATISGPGGGIGDLGNPIGVALDPGRRRVLVSDYGPLTPGGYASVKIFGYDGTFEAEISGEGTCSLGSCTDGFSRPQGLAVDGTGRIYLADALLAQVLVFDPVSFRRVGVMSDRSMLRLPTDLVIGLGGDLFVASNRAREVRVMRGGASP
jgi:hypothetical protein